MPTNEDNEENESEVSVYVHEHKKKLKWLIKNNNILDPLDSFPKRFEVDNLHVAVDDIRHDSD